MTEPQQELESTVGTLFTNLREEAKVDPGIQPGYDIIYQGSADRVNMVQFRGEFKLLTDNHRLIKLNEVESSSRPPDLITDVDIGEVYQIRVKHADKVNYGDEILKLMARVLAQRSLGPGSWTYLRTVDSGDICLVLTDSLKEKETQQPEIHADN